jgi:DNA-binding NarL/FixJ family response regulator
MIEASKILIVEDSQFIQERLVKQISPYSEFSIAGFAKNVHDAIMKFDLLMPNIVILDMKLETGFGLEVLVHIRNVSKECVVIVFTNYANESIRNECLELGANYFLDKSFDFDKVIEKCLESVHVSKKHNNINLASFLL